VSYEIRQGPDPGTGSGDRPYEHGCASLGLQQDTAPNGLEINALDHPPGEYQVAAW
jgi:hypothetical protein